MHLVARLLILGSLLSVTSGLRAQEEVPFIVTPDRVTLEMLQMAGVGAADHLIDLGSGDGRIVLTAAKRFGATALGIEIVPDLVRRSREHAKAAGVADRVAFLEQDLFAADLSRASVVTMYLLPAVNLQLRPRLLALAPGTRIVSHDWDLGDWQPDRSVTLDVPDKPIGRSKSSQVHFWVVPAPVDGLWCDGGAGLRVTQRFQRFSATLTEAGADAPLAVVDGRIDGMLLSGDGTHPVEITLRGDTLQWRAKGAMGGNSPRGFVRAGAGGCGPALAKPS